MGVVYIREIIFYMASVSHSRKYRSAKLTGYNDGSYIGIIKLYGINMHKNGKKGITGGICVIVI